MGYRFSRLSSSSLHLRGDTVVEHLYTAGVYEKFVDVTLLRMNQKSTLPERRASFLPAFVWLLNPAHTRQRRKSGPKFSRRRSAASL